MSSARFYYTHGPDKLHLLSHMGLFGNDEKHHQEVREDTKEKAKQL